MAESHSTLGTRFAESKILAKINKTDSSEPFLHTNANENEPDSLSNRLFIAARISHSVTTSAVKSDLPELMNALRSHINNVLRLPLPVQSRSRLVRNYWELEFLVEEIRLLLD